MLKIENLSVNYGNITALRNLSFEVAQGELLAVIGSNGAGKTTLLKTISSLIRARSGKILLHGVSLQDLAPHKIVALGVAHCPEGRKVFASQSVKDNLLLGSYLRYAKAGKKEIQKDIEHAFELFPRLRERQNQQAGTLSGGEQQMLAIARAMMLKPQLLMLDEPSMGLAPVIIDEVFRVIKQMKDTRETTVLLVEQLAYRALSIADRGIVIEQGTFKLGGPASELMQNPEVRKAYLGESSKS